MMWAIWCWLFYTLKMRRHGQDRMNSMRFHSLQTELDMKMAGRWESKCTVPSMRYAYNGSFLPKFAGDRLQCPGISPLHNLEMISRNFWHAWFMMKVTESLLRWLRCIRHLSRLQRWGSNCWRSTSCLPLFETTGRYRGRWRGMKEVAPLLLYRSLWQRTPPLIWMVGERTSRSRCVHSTTLPSHPWQQRSSRRTARMISSIG